MGITVNLHLSRQRIFCIALATMLLLGCSFQGLRADILLDDHFDDGDIATGGTNGGFVEIGNAQEADVELSESGSVATIEFFSIQANPNKGMVSIEPLNLAGTGGFRATFVVNEVTDNRCCNGHFVGISDDNVTFFRAIKNFGIAFFGNDARTDSGDGFGLVINDIGNPGAETILSSEDIELDSYLDGFTASFTADPEGWSYEVSDVNDFDGEPATFSDSGDWTSAGLANSFYEDFFDDDEYVFVSSQINNGDQLHSYDRITVESLGVSAILGDYNSDGSVDALDIDLQAAAMRDPNPDLSVFDENGDQVVDPADRFIWVSDHAGTWIGDADLNGEFNSGDLVQVFSSGEYDDAVDGNSSWSTGDWNGDGDFGSGDLVVAFTDGGYELGPRVAGAAVPEPSSAVVLLFSATTVIACTRRRKRSPAAITP